MGGVANGVFFWQLQSKINVFFSVHQRVQRRWRPRRDTTMPDDQTNADCTRSVSGFNFKKIYLSCNCLFYLLFVEFILKLCMKCVALLMKKYLFLSKFFLLLTVYFVNCNFIGNIGEKLYNFSTKPSTIESQVV